MFNENLSKLFEILNCTNAEFEHATGYTSSSLSRFRTGRRIPKTTSISVKRLVDCIYLYADTQNAIPLLCSVCECDNKNNAEIRSAITKWLYSTSENIKINETLYKNRQKKNLSFGNKLDSAMILLNLSNAKLSKMTNIDPSHLSRFRNGVRLPKINGYVFSRICTALYECIKKQYKFNEFAKLANIRSLVLSEDAESAIIAISDWLFDKNTYTHSSYIDSFLDKFDSFSSDNSMNLPPFNVIAPENILNDTSNTYFSINGLRQAVIRFLGNTAKSNGRELWLYSDEAMEWLLSDNDFLNKWKSLMAYSLRSNTKIKIIHNIDRNVNEMISAIESWLPLYMSGLIEPYYAKQPNNSRFSHTLFLSPKQQCITSSYIRGCEDLARYSFYTDKENLSLLEAEFNALLTSCNPLIKIFPNSIDFMNVSNKSGGVLYSLLHSPSIATMPQKLLLSILKRNNITNIENILRFYEIQKSEFFKALLSGEEIREFVPIANKDEILANNTFLNFHNLFPDIKIAYSYEEYAEHLKYIANLIDTYTNYNFYPIPESPFKNVQMIVRNESATILKNNKPCSSMLFEQPLMFNAFKEYFDYLKNQNTQERNAVKKQCLNFE